VRRVLEIGSTIGDYRLDERIGRGGMGVVYRATQLSLGRPVALKLIAPDLAQEAEFRVRFKREARLAARIDHPNIVPVHQSDEQDGYLFIAMRYVPGIDLKALLRRHGRLNPEHALRIVEQVAAALDAAHDQGLVHRDVKPANVLLTVRRAASMPTSRTSA
jgi:serine/threonine protein kinase